MKQHTNIQLLNTFLATASPTVQTIVGTIKNREDVVRFGELLPFNEGLRNEFYPWLFNKVTDQYIHDKAYTNKLGSLKKGRSNGPISHMLMDWVKAQDFRPDKANEREFKRSFHKILEFVQPLNYSTTYSGTVDQTFVNQIFTDKYDSNTFFDMVSRVINKSAEWDEEIVYTHSILEHIAKGKTYVLPIKPDLEETLTQAQATAGTITYPSSKFNSMNYLTFTKPDEVIILLTPEKRARFNKVYAHLFNPEYLNLPYTVVDIMSLDTYKENIPRLENLVASDGSPTGKLSKLTEDALELLKKVDFIMVDKQAFLFYDNTDQMESEYIKSGMYVNMWRHVIKSIAINPAANFITFVEGEQALPESVEYTVDSVSGSDDTKTFALKPTESYGFSNGFVKFLPTDVENGIAVNEIGEVLFTKKGTSTTLKIDIQGTKYTAQATLTPSTQLGTKIAFKKG